MTPKEKAEELVNKFGPLVMWKMGQEDVKRRAKGCAIMAVKEIEEALQEYDERNDTFELQNMDGDFRYWQRVKEEIEKL